MKQKGFINIILVASIVVIVIIAGLISYFLFFKTGSVIQQPTPVPDTTLKPASSKTTFSPSTVDLCKKDKEFSDGVRSSPECTEQDFRCVDGWSVKVYYDKRLTTTTPENGSPFHIPEELKNAVIAEYGKSSCNCKAPISYKILSDGKLKEIGCENFYNFIENYKSSCDNCVLTWETECC